MLSCEQLSVLGGRRLLVDRLDLKAGPGRMLAVLGPNGSGKSLTLQTLAGLRAPGTGRVLLDGLDLAGLSRRQVALRLGLLLQDDEENFPATVLESALLGRHPHRSRWWGPTPLDLDHTRAALAAMELGDMANRDTTSLSGGERRRLALARLLAQDTGVLLLDEPTNHLDPRHQIQIMGRLADLAGHGRTVLVSLHDPSLALRFAADTLLLHGDGRWRLGATADVLDAGALEALFNTPYDDFHSARRDRALLPRAPAA